LAGGIPNGSTHDGTDVDCDLPKVLRVRNTVGTDGLGLCVWASTEMMARYLGCRELVGVFRQMQGEPGGGWPERVDRVMKQRAPGIKYRQFLGNANDGLAFIQAGINSRRPVCVTYGYGELYNMQTIAHMVMCVGMNRRWTAILDNNDPEHIWWMETGEFAKRFVHPHGQGWAWYVMTPPPPPVPRN